MSEICPECGKEAVEVARYTGHAEGVVAYKHKIDYSGQFPEVVDSCVVRQ